MAEWKNWLVERLPWIEGFETDALSKSLGSVILVVLTVAAWRLFRGYVLPTVKRLASTTDNVLDDILVAMLKSIRWWAVYAIAARVALLPWDLPARWESGAQKIFIIVLFIQIGITLRAGYHTLFDAKIRVHAESRPGLKTSIDLIRGTGAVIIELVVILVALSNLGFDISALVAGLGIGGIAVALGVQKVLADFFASLFIVLDRPFEAGDAISVGDVNGNVEKVGLRTTRVRSSNGEEVIVSNAELASARVRNFGRLKERRVVTRFGVEYGASREQLMTLTQELRRIIESTAQTRLDRAHFVGFGASSLDLELVYYVTTSDYNVYMDTQQNVNFRVMDAVAAHKLAFAYPTQTIQVRQ
jgi:small-conductance mechanosensitive channel